MSHSKSILLIDDDKSMHELCSVILNKAGYRCFSAFNGSEGLEKIATLRPDLILLDYMMPGMDGAQVYRELIFNDKYAAHKDIPVIILTAKTDDGVIRNKLLELGVAAYLNKPFGLNELLNVIENVFVTHEIKLRNRRLREEIDATKRYLERLLDNAPVGIFSTDHDGQIVRVNPFLVEMLGEESADDLVGRDILTSQFLDAPGLVEKFHEALRQGRPFEATVVDYLSPHGRRMRIKLRGVPLRDAGGQITGLIGLVEDITETEKRAYELSILGQIGEAMQGTLELENLLHLILTSITAGCALGFSRAMIFLVNQDKAVLEGRMGVGPASQEDAVRIWSALAEDNVNLEAFLRKYGMSPPPEPTPFDSKVRRVKIPLDRAWDVVVQTVKERKVFKVEDASKDTRVNQDFIETFGMEEFVTVPLITKDKVIGVVVADNKYSGQPIAEDKIKLLTLFANQAGLALERAAAYKDLEGKIEMVREAYRKLQDAQDRLVRSEKLAAVGSMAAHVAHEIRNPLVTIGGFARSILKTPEKVDENKTSAAIIAEEVMRLEKILANVLDFTKLAKPMRCPTDFNTIVKETCFQLKDSIEDKGITLLQNLDSDTPTIMVDPQQMKQALFNILQNAILSMPDGGELSVTTHQNRGALTVEIKDSGPGIPAEVLENIFNPFFTTRPGGTGLGLAVTQKIIEDHGGKIEVESKVGKGTTFRINLPIGGEDYGATAVSSPTSSPIESSRYQFNGLRP